MRITPQELIELLQQFNQKLNEVHVLAQAELTVLQAEADIEGENER